MVGDLAPGVVSTHARAGVHALLVDAGSQLVTVGADHALGAAGRWSALVRWQTGAHTHAVDLSVLAVGSTWVGVAGICWFNYNWRRRNERAGRERVTIVASVTGADRVVVSDRALGIAATCARTRVGALLLHTCQVVGALCVDKTLGPAADIWVADVVRDAATGASSVS